MINAEQQQIIHFLRGNPDTAFSAMEISRRAGTRKQFEAEPRWAINSLRYLVDLKVVERDARGHYKILITPETEMIFRGGVSVKSTA